MSDNLQGWADAASAHPPSSEAPALPIEQHIAACAVALEAARTAAEQASLLLRNMPRQSQAMGELLNNLCGAWANASDAYENYQQVLNCRGQA